MLAIDYDLEIHKDSEEKSVYVNIERGITEKYLDDT